MGKITGFMEIERETPPRRPVSERLKDWREYELKMPEDKLRAQGARCMDCGIPFCHKGCPLGNIIPDWNDLIYRGRWREAIDRLHSTNNFPGVHRPHLSRRRARKPASSTSTTIRSRSSRSRRTSSITPGPKAGSRRSRAARSTGKTVAVVGSGPVGTRVRAATRARRPRGDALRALGSHRRAADVRDSRLQAGEVARQSARRADEGRGRRASSPVAASASTSTADELRAQYRRDRADDRRDQAARSAGARAASSRASTSRWSSCRSRTSATPATRSRPAISISAKDKTRRDPRRRRHRLGLPRHLESPGRDRGAPVRVAADAARPAHRWRCRGRTGR